MKKEAKNMSRSHKIPKAPTEAIEKVNPVHKTPTGKITTTKELSINVYQPYEEMGELEDKIN